MSTENIICIIERVIQETEYRKLLTRNPPEALKDYNLTEAERLIFLDLPFEDVDILMGSLEERISRSLPDIEYTGSLGEALDRLLRARIIKHTAGPMN